MFDDRLHKANLLFMQFNIFFLFLDQIDMEYICTMLSIICAQMNNPVPFPVVEGAAISVFISQSLIPWLSRNEPHVPQLSLLYTVQNLFPNSITIYLH